MLAMAPSLLSNVAIPRLQAQEMVCPEDPDNAGDAFVDELMQLGVLQERGAHVEAGIPSFMDFACRTMQEINQKNSSEHDGASGDDDLSGDDDTSGGPDI